MKIEYVMKQVGPGDDPEDWQLVAVPAKEAKKAEAEKKDEKDPE